MPYVHTHVPAQVYIMFHKSHTSISRPAFLVVVADNILIVGVRMLSEVPLNQLSCLLRREPSNRHTDSYHKGGGGRGYVYLKKM